jgi:hypothetical protein
MTQAELKEFFTFKLSGAKNGMTARELAILAGLDPSKTRHYDALARLAEANIIEKSDSTFFITDYGLSTLKSPLTQTVETPVETVEAAPIIEESALTQIEEPVVNESLTTEIPINKMELETFDVFQLTDNLASSFISLMQSKKEKPIENIDYKIATLESLADIYNPKISATLREIAADLRS